MHYSTLPYNYNNTPFNRIIVKPIRIAEKVSESGLIIPEHEARLCEIGKVISSCPESDIKEGDEVLYAKLDRQSGEHIDTASIDGEVYDVIFEREIWSVNEQPYNRIFVEPISEMEVNASGIVVPDGIKGVTQKGRVFLSPDKYGLSSGDRVEYRKQEGGQYPEVELNGIVYDVLYEADIFTINGDVAPCRIVVRIDMAAQAIKRNTSNSGLKLSPLFIAMLHNLQYAKVMEIGKEARKMFPNLRAGNSVIIHHVVESQPYRLLAQEYGKHGGVTYEYRIINCWDEKSGEVIGKLNYEADSGKILNITPFSGTIFCGWELRMFEALNPDSLGAGSTYDLSQYNNLDGLKYAISFMRKNAAENAKIKIGGIRRILQQTDPEADKDRYDQLDSEFRTAQREETKLALYLHKDHLVVCKAIYPETGYVIALHEELYPLNILGKKFLVAHPLFVIAKSKAYMNITLADLSPLNGYVIVSPIIEERNTELSIPDSAKEKPQKGIVEAVEDGASISKGDVVLFRQNAGLEETIEGKKYLILRQNDLLARATTTI